MARADDATGDFMCAALALARRNLGQTWPNPAVGCVLVREDLASVPVIVGRGWTARGGRPHAETEALREAGALATGATAYVTLEPCAHHGQTSPCAQALIDAQIARAVVAVEDPDGRVSGRGIAMLKGAGISVDVGVEKVAATQINAGFFKRVKRSLPLVTLKLATTLDGRIATHSGKSQWITGPRARAEGHRLRAEHDAVLIGGTTAMVDDPLLTVRLPGQEDRSPVRVIADGRLQLSLTSQLALGAKQHPTWVLARPDCARGRHGAFGAAGIDVIEVEPGKDGRPELRLGLELLAARGITRVLAEGGARLAAALLRDNLIDDIAWFRSNAVMGGDGTSAVEGFGVAELAELRRFRLTGVRRLGEDLMETYARAS